MESKRAYSALLSQIDKACKTPMKTPAADSADLDKSPRFPFYFPMPGGIAYRALSPNPGEV